MFDNWADLVSDMLGKNDNWADMLGKYDNWADQI